MTRKEELHKSNKVEYVKVIGRVVIKLKGLSRDLQLSGRLCCIPWDSLNYSTYSAYIV